MGFAVLPPVHVMRDLAHELCQPLSTIETAASYLRIVNGRDVRAVQQADRILEMVEQMAWLLEDAVENWTSPALSPRWLDLREPIGAEAARRGTIEWIGSDPAPLVRMDPEQARRLARCLLLGFQRFSDGEPMTISLTRQSSHAVLRCSTTGTAGRTGPVLDMVLTSVRRVAESHGGFAHASATEGAVAIEVHLPA